MSAPTSPGDFKWPPRCQLNFYTKGDNLFLSCTSRLFDLSDALMMEYAGNQRTVVLGLSTKSSQWSVWDNIRLREIEWLIQYDLTFDGYHVRTERLSQLGARCSEEFRWKLNIRRPVTFAGR